MRGEIETPETKQERLADDLHYVVWGGRAKHPLLPDYVLVYMP